jgi:hypothetical protein
MEKKKYEWKMAYLAKGVDPDLAVAELERIEAEYGALTPEILLEASKEENALLHKLFLWDDQLAAHQYRLQQARTIINNVEVIIISDGQPRQVPVFEIIRKDDLKSYKSITDFTTSDIEQVRGQTIREINALKNKLSVYNQFSKATVKLDEAVELLK